MRPGATTRPSRRFAKTLQLDPTLSRRAHAAGRIHHRLRRARRGPQAPSQAELLLRPEDPQHPAGPVQPPDGQRPDPRRGRLPQAADPDRAQQRRRLAEPRRRPVRQAQQYEAELSAARSAGARRRKSADDFQPVRSYENIHHYAKALHWIKEGLRIDPRDMPSKNSSSACW